MYRPRGANALLTALLLLLIAGLAVLATLQYRWIDRVTSAERQQMRANIDFAAHRFIDSFDAELEQVFAAFDDGGADVASRYRDWKETTLHPALISGVYVLDLDRDNVTLQRLDPGTGQLVPAPWPPSLAGLRQRFASRNERGPRGPFVPDALTLLIGHPPPPLPPPGEPGPEPERRPGRRPRGPFRLVLLQLDRAELARVIFPELTKRHFSTHSGVYDVAVLQGESILYRSSTTWPDGDRTADLELPFVPLLRRQGFPPPFGLGGPPPEARAPLRLLVRRTDGGVEAAIDSARTRNLVVSFSILLILGATIALLLALLRRAGRLRAQQTEFVAAMSHELNTPVAAVRSAGENLRDGIVTDPEKIARYGTSIVREASRLGDMLGQVLEYAGMQARRGAPSRETVDAGSVIDEAVAQSRWLVDGTAIHIATTIEAGLPPVDGDAKALTSAVQNLIANAIRYGGSGNWIGVRAAQARNGSIEISVEDRGPGIDSRDAAHIFEPFYRGKDHGTTRGAGLGLSIVQRIVDAHGGSVTLERRPRKEGAAFTIRLPAKKSDG